MKIFVATQGILYEMFHISLHCIRVNGTTFTYLLYFTTQYNFHTKLQYQVLLKVLFVVN